MTNVGNAIENLTALAEDPACFIGTGAHMADDEQESGVQLGLRLDAELSRRVEEAARRARLPKATWIRQQIEQALDQVPPEPSVRPEVRAAAQAFEMLLERDRAAALAISRVARRLADDPEAGASVASVVEFLGAAPPAPRAKRSNGPTRQRRGGGGNRR